MLMQHKMQLTFS